MNALPLIQRELLVGARLRSTYWLRLVTALGSTLSGLLLLFAIMRGRLVPGQGAPGITLFMVLASIGLATTSLFGVFFAADTISSERRENTLGLLFLTRLRATDVVIAKLIVTTLRTAFTLLAALPVFALPLLLGGVTFRSYGLVALVLGNTLLLSVSVGLAVSSFSRQPVRAVLTTLFVMMAFGVGTVWLDLVIAATREMPFKAYASLFSPARAILVAVTTGGSDIWALLVLQHVCAWLLLGVATLGTGRLTEKVRQSSQRPFLRRLRGRFASHDDPQLRDRRPVQWLVQRRNRLPTILALSVLGGSVVWAVTSLLHQDHDVWPDQLTRNLSSAARLFEFITLIWIAATSTRMTGDARRDGALELMLVTPLPVAWIVQGFWRGLCRVFGPALFVIILLLLFASVVELHRMLDYFNLSSKNGYPFAQEYFYVQLTGKAWGFVNLIAMFAAVVWVGCWLGVRMERPAPAIAVTWLLTAVAPTILSLLVEVFGNILLSTRGQGLETMRAIVFTRGISSLLVLACFIIWARKKLLVHLRDVVAGNYQPRRPTIRKQFSPRTRPVTN